MKELKEFTTTKLVPSAWIPVKNNLVEAFMQIWNHVKNWQDRNNNIADFT